MTSKLTLETEIPLELHIIQANISRIPKIPYLLPILAHVQEQKRGATPESLSDELFLGRPLSLELLKICQNHYLIEEDRAQRYGITETGSIAVEEKKVFVNEEAAWEVYYSPHTILPDECRIVKLAKSKEAGYVRGDMFQPKPRPLEAHIEKLKDRLMEPIFGEKRSLRINDIKPYAKKLKSGMTVRVFWRIDEGGSMLRLRTSANEEATLKGPDTTYGEVWDTLMKQNDIHHWDYKHNRLLVSYDDAEAGERDGMKRTLRFEPEICGWGFDQLAKDVGVYPRFQNDAQKWAKWMLAYRIKDYLTRDAYKKLKTEIEDQFPDFEVCLGDRADHIPWERSPRFWHIQAMEDWNL